MTASSAAPTVSVVIPTNRRSPYLGETVQSVVSQTFVDWELVVVEDGASSSADELDLPPDRLRIVRSSRVGLSRARNLGVEAARGTYVAFLDDDDRWLPGKLEVQVALLSANPAIGMCHTQFQYIDSSGAVVGRGWSEQATYEEMLSGAWGVSTSATVYPRECVRAVGGCGPEFEMTGDLDLLFKVARRWPTCFIPDVLSEYRVHSDNMSRARIRQLREAQAVLEHHRELAREVGDSRKVELAQIGIADLHRHYRSSALRRARRALRSGRFVRALAEAGLVTRLAFEGMNRRSSSQSGR